MTDTDMKISYATMLRQLQDELDGMDEKRQAILATIAGMKRLVADDEMPDQAFPPAVDAQVRMPVIPPHFFSKMTPTEAYRELMKRWPGHYRPPQIADLFIEGGMTSHATRTGLVQAIHSVVKRERDRKKAEDGRRTDGILPIAQVRRG